MSLTKYDCIFIAMLSLDNHCSNLTSLFKQAPYFSEWTQVTDWLLIASSIKRVELDTIQHCPAFGFCEGSDYADLAKEEVLVRFVKTLTVFNYLWGAVECLIDGINPPNTNNGKINSAYTYLSAHFDRRPVLTNYNSECANFWGSARKCLDSVRVEERRKNLSKVGLSAIGLYGVYQLRNSFAHGNLLFPSPYVKNDNIYIHTELVEHACRLTLFSIQMLLLAYYQESEIEIKFSWFPNADDEDIALCTILRSCHISRENLHFQESLF